MSGGFNLSAAEPDCCSLLFHICILPSVFASLPSPNTNYYTPISILLHLFPPLITATVTAVSLASAFPRLSHSFLLTLHQLSQVFPLPCSILHLPTSSCGSARTASTTTKLPKPSDFIAILSSEQIHQKCVSLQDFFDPTLQFHLSQATCENVA